MSNAVLVVAVAHFSSGILEEFLTSLQHQTNADWELMLVDNSCDETERANLRAVVERYPNSTLLVASENLGYFGGAQFALREVDVSQFAWVVVCNVDIHFEPDALSNLAEFTGPYPDASVVAPRIVSELTGADQNPYMIERPTRSGMAKAVLMFRSLSVARLVVRVASSRARASRGLGAHGPVRIYAAHGSCIAFHRKYFLAGADLHHPIFLFAEELTVAERARTLGLVTYYAPTVRVKHKEHHSTGVWRSSFVLREQRRSTRYAWDLLFGGRS